MAKRRIMRFDLDCPREAFGEAAGSVLLRAAHKLALSDETGYSLKEVKVSEEEIIFEYREIEQVAGWSEGCKVRSVRFRPMAGTDDLFSERRERWLRARARFEWPDEGERFGGFRFAIERDHELTMKREFVLRGDNSKRLLEWFPLGGSVEFSIRCQVSAERALDLMARTDDPRFAWTTPMRDKLPVIKRMMTRGELGYADADRAVGEAMGLLEKVAGERPGERLSLDERSFDFLDVVFDLLQDDSPHPAHCIAAAMVADKSALTEFGVSEGCWDAALERGVLEK